MVLVSVRFTAKTCAQALLLPPPGDGGSSIAREHFWFVFALLLGIYGVSDVLMLLAKTVLAGSQRLSEA